MLIDEALPLGIPVPILKGNTQLMKEIRKRLYENEFKELLVIDFSNVAQGCNDYDDFTCTLSRTSESDQEMFSA